ncbi:NAD(P)-dependent oxidoreductase [Polynucleobacter sp. JS-Safj-400b-B2]|uniref:NAD-dependent epimerase/dehydratase family protein n=1 Tax=Polynucleobacter sp. JS-Safj-400b-B2 TaxID=2576921 RepID=UPI001C0CB05A|nr:NAD(P)-dependent oxidoreductase [Polynucleobacter sp. JS-Safj-400b-B2]
MAKLLVIGGSGFFGKSILSAFKRGLLHPWGVDRVAVVARRASQLAIDHPELVGAVIELLDVDIGSTKIIPDADYIIHAAASTNAANYLSQPQVERDNIQAATYNFCRLIQNKQNNPRIVYTSSGAVYGQQDAKREFLSESAPLKPVESLAINKRDYALAKRDAEAAIEKLGQQGFSVSIARCFAFVGQYLPRDQHFAIGNFIGDGLAVKPITVSATKSVYRSYMYADDLVKWLMTIAHSSSPQCPIYNVGSDDAVEIRELAKMVGDYFGVNIDAAEINSPDTDRYVPSVEKAFAELGLKVEYDLSSSISETAKQIQGA